MGCVQGLREGIGPQFLFPHSQSRSCFGREHRAFAVEAYFSNGRFIVATQRAFRARFNIPPRSPIPGRNLILSWVTALRVRQSFLQSPRRSARKHAAALRLSDRTMRRIIHNELQFHPYKLVVVPRPTQHGPRWNC